jgi:hypothetical protein
VFLWLLLVKDLLLNLISGSPVNDATIHAVSDQPSSQLTQEIRSGHLRFGTGTVPAVPTSARITKIPPELAESGAAARCGDFLFGPVAGS